MGDKMSFITRVNKEVELNLYPANDILEIKFQISEVKYILRCFLIREKTIAFVGVFHEESDCFCDVCKENLGRMSKCLPLNDQVVDLWEYLKKYTDERFMLMHYRLNKTVKNSIDFRERI